MSKTKKSVSRAEVTIDRRRSERRNGQRRTADQPPAAERRQSPRRKVQRRRQIDPTTCERDYTADEIEFMKALDAYKRQSGRMFPTCSEVLEVIRALGYVKQSPAAAESAPGTGADEASTDKTEPAAPAR